jgi:aspartyl-tRNA(Asn)/glutamyl-tRNA(Gln) amidotransferase subunit A
MQLYELTIHEAHALLKKKEISSEELTRSVLERIDAVENKLGAYITITADTALDQARLADKEISKGRCQPLTGIPLAIKDLICTKGVRTTCASRILENFIPPYDATVAQKLKEAGAVFVGKVNMDEFAMGSSTENSGLKLTRNPWDLDRIPGGSSGGSAVAVSADMSMGALGSDTGGSIRQPASHCGVVGMKPTYGRVSRYGLVAFASSLDQIGPLAKDVTDCASLMNVIAGYDPADSTSVLKDVPDYTRFLDNGLKCVDISLPYTDYLVAVYYVIAPSEASSNLARYDGVKYGYRNKDENELLEMYRGTRSNGFGPEVQRRIIIGTYCLSAGYYDAYYGKASAVRTLIIEDFKKAFETCDVILTPVAPTPAFKIGEKIDDPLTMYLSDVFTISANLAGIPGMSVPCGFSAEGLPIGLQLLGRHFEEEKLIKLAYNFEQATEFHLTKPEL